ncbi:hypothetical protein [Brevundimonas sp.]|uniref:hypothetical protein n=1 Tax=Brevundimonas sp. TaxID=1871086 RepID=UPI00198F0E61|nr:hypothetical protein [Brevundimonas sp.]MBD3837521.1 hypothetical protein [Brevundimonas sp.]
MIRFTAASALALLTLAACDRSQPAAPAPSPEATTEAPAPAAQPVADNVLTAEGLGQARIGMTLGELTAAWGADANPGLVGGADPQACGEFHPAKAPQGVNVMIQNGVLTRITLMRDAAVKTDRGIAVGDQAAAVKQAYGDALVAQPHKYEAAPAEDLFAWTKGGSSQYVTDATARGVRYEVGSDGKVKMIHAGDPSIQLVEGCA